MKDDPELRIVDNPGESRYRAFLGDVDVAYSEYETGPNRIIFTHTVVKPEHEGRGVGSRLAKFAIEDARTRGLRITPICPFIRAYLRRHREYDSIVDYPSAHREPANG